MDIMKIFHDKKTKRYCLICPGLILESDVFATIDSNCLLFHKAHPPSLLFILVEPDKTIKFSDLVFYANCFSYLHDLPVFFRNFDKNETFISKPLIKFKNRKEYKGDDAYFENIALAYEPIVELRINGSIFFKWDKAYYKKVNINLTSTYTNAAKEIQLYAMALKQVDPLTEYLCYYRVIESLSNDNGKNYIKANLGKINKHRYGFLGLHQLSLKEVKRQKNYFTYCKRRAIRRLLNLQNQGIVIEDYLYNRVRCGIANGRKNVITFDFDSYLNDVSEDLYLIKMLARIGIDERI
jgi:hypothetical protein